MDTFYQKCVNFSLHIINFTYIVTMKKSRKYKALLVDSGFFQKSE